MAIFTKESLEALRQRIDLVEVLLPHVELKKAGASYKALCPFHDEKSPSFTVQKGDSHYHCFGCGAHGDAIGFLMNHLKISFLDAVEGLARQFNISLQKTETSPEAQGPNKSALKEALEQASIFYHFYLLQTQEGALALEYLYSRGLDLDFIRSFQIGLAPKVSGIFRKTLHSKFIKDKILLEAGLLSESPSGGYRDFFYDRIVFPIRDPQGAVIGFSGRKYKEETYGGKYVNTPETPLFKKSRVLYGLNYCRKRIVKERKAIIVEGQIDALRLIQLGFNITVAGQGTAFGEGHAKELINLGVQQVFIATDGDGAGEEAACKIGHLFQKEGIEVFVLALPPQSDPDGFLSEYGPDAFMELMENSFGYLEFLVKCRSKILNMDSPAGKNELVHAIAKQIRSWEHPLMVHESLRKLAFLAGVPESVIGIGEEHQPNIYVRKSAIAGLQSIDPDRILESDCLRWMLLMGQNQPHFFELAVLNLKPEDFKSLICRKIYQASIDCFEAKTPCDLLSLTIHLDDAEGQEAISEILEKKVNKERAEEQFLETIQRMLDRNWMMSREEIKMKIQSGNCSDDEAMDLLKIFDQLKGKAPKVIRDKEPSL